MFDLGHAVRAYRPSLDADDRTLAVGPPLLVRSFGPSGAITSTTCGIAIAMALRDLNIGVNSALRFDDPPRPTGSAKREMERPAGPTL
jgi:hypothetical protein